MALDPATQVGDGDIVWLLNSDLQFKIAVAIHFGGDAPAEFMVLGTDWYRDLEPDETVHSIVSEPRL